MVGVGGIVSVGGGGVGSGSTSGIATLNPGGNTGPTVAITGVNGVEVTGGSNQIVIDGAGASGKFAASFVGITSGLFTHNLNTMDVIVQVRDASTGGASVLMPDMIVVENMNQISLLFNTPQTGRVVVV